MGFVFSRSTAGLLSSRPHPAYPEVFPYTYPDIFHRWVTEGVDRVRYMMGMETREGPHPYQAPEAGTSGQCTPSFNVQVQQKLHNITTHLSDIFISSR